MEKADGTLAADGQNTAFSGQWLVISTALGSEIFTLIPHPVLPGQVSCLSILPLSLGFGHPTFIAPVHSVQ